MASVPHCRVNGGCTSASSVLVSTSCFSVGGVALKCSLPMGIIGEVNFRGLQFTMATSGLCMFARLGNVSPRCDVANNAACICAPSHAVSFDISIGFWYGSGS